GLRRQLTTEAVYGSCYTLTLENNCCLDLFNTWSRDSAAISAVFKESRPSNTGALDPLSAGILPSIETVLELDYSRGTDYCLR
ncbi:hypothetical protein BpHYR1_029561, partial [Brachionus plicatilis]